MLFRSQADHQVRHVYLTGKHSARITPTDYGESIGHYEGDTLVVDTVGIDAKTFVDNFETPHTEKLHTVERFHISPDGKTLEVNLHVEDPGAFTTPWDAVQRYRRIDASGSASDARVPRGPLEEMVCAENNGDHFNQNLIAMPTADRQDF